MIFPHFTFFYEFVTSASTRKVQLWPRVTLYYRVTGRNIMIDGFEDGTEYQMRKGECSKGFVNTLFDNQEGNFYFISGHKEELQGHSQM